jgi:acetyltransferase-like isoleucine patch superfamily enzyme
MNELEQSRDQSYLRLLNQEKSNAHSRPSFKEIVINNFPFPRSQSFIFLLRYLGMKIGADVKIMGRIRFKVRGRFDNIIIGDEVVIGKNVDLRNRENGVIDIGNKVYLDENVRIVAARDGSVKIDIGAELGANTIINSGGITTIGKYSLLAGFININSSSHGTKIHSYIKDQPHEHGTVSIGDDVWVGSYAAVLMNSKIGNGSVIGSHSVVIGEIPSFSIAVGVPAKVIKSRT